MSKRTRSFVVTAALVLAGSAVAVALGGRGAPERLRAVAALDDGRVALVTSATEGTRAVVVRLLTPDLAAARWEVALAGVDVPGAAADGPLAADDGALYVVVDASRSRDALVRDVRAVALDQATGGVRWSVSVPPASDASVAAPAAGRRPLLAGSWLLVPTEEDGALVLRAIDRATGALGWRYARPGRGLPPSAAIWFADGALALLAYDGTVVLDATTGVVRRATDDAGRCLAGGRVLAQRGDDLVALGRGLDEPDAVAVGGLSARVGAGARALRCGQLGDALVVELARDGARIWAAFDRDGGERWRAARRGFDDSAAVAPVDAPSSAPLTGALERFATVVDATPSGRALAIVDLATGRDVRRVTLGARAVAVVRAGRWAVVHDVEDDRALAVVDEARGEVVGGLELSAPLVLPSPGHVAADRLVVAARGDARLAERGVAVLALASGALVARRGALAAVPGEPIVPATGAGRVVTTTR